MFMQDEGVNTGMGDDQVNEDLGDDTGAPKEDTNLEDTETEDANLG